jgi:hypothetical protein
MKKAVVFLAAAMLAASAFGEITLAQFNRVKNGMSFSQVKSILGPPTVEFMRVEYGDHSEVVYQWETRDGTGTAGVGLMNDKVTAKTQFGLK